MATVNLSTTDIIRMESPEKLIPSVSVDAETLMVLYTSLHVRGCFHVLSDAEYDALDTAKNILRKKGLLLA